MLGKDKVCLLKDPRVTIVPQDPGEPPSWTPFFPGSQIFWVDRNVFEALIARRHNNPCDICPDEIKEKCDRKAKAIEMT
jgi:hypothetical protein